MDLILCHTTADFDAFGAAVGLSRLYPGSRIVLSGGAHPAVRDFLALYRDEFALIERRAVNATKVKTQHVVDTQLRDRATGAVTLVVERLQAAGMTPTVAEATVMALGIHVDTGSLTDDHCTARDAAAIAWLMTQGVDVTIVGHYVALRRQARTIARELMSAPVRTVLPETTIDEAQRILLRYGHSGLSVVDALGELVGVISRRDLDIAFHHGFGHAPVKGYMTKQVKTIAPETPLHEIEAVMVRYDIGRLPVIDAGLIKNKQLVGIVTRTDVIRYRHRQQRSGTTLKSTMGITKPSLTRLAKPLQDLLSIIAEKAQERGWHLYLVGGGVRDLLLATGDEPVMLSDLDLVVDGYHRSAESGAGMILAEALQALYPAARLEVHGKFQTAALLWHKDPVLDSLWIDIATARTEFYPYPAANPEVEASSIQQDLYRRDFTINALALRLTEPNAGEMLDFFGGVEDLQNKQVKVLHANSFIEDPTRIYRGVRFAVRLGFGFDRQTEEYIRHAIASGIYQKVAEKQVAPALQTRLKAELRYILQTPYWRSAIQQLADLDALKCIHPTLQLTKSLWQELRLMEYWLKRFDAENRLMHWQMLLEVLIAGIVPEDRSRVAQNLQMTAESIGRLGQLAEVEVAIGAKLPGCRLPSQVVELLQGYDLGLLLLVGVRLRSRRQMLRQYLSHWSQVKPILNGNDLRELGYKPGKAFKEILAGVLAATLDGEIGDRAGAIEFVRQRYVI